MVSIIKVSLLVHFTLITLSLCLSRTPILAVTGNSRCYFPANSHLIQCINNVYKSKQNTPTQLSAGANKHLRISTAELLNIRLYFWTVLHSSYSFPFSAFPPASPLRNKC